MRSIQISAALLIILSFFLPWLSSPITENDISFYIKVNAMVLGVYSFIGLCNRSPITLYRCGALGATLCIISFFWLTLFSSTFWILIHEYEQSLAIIEFTEQYFVPNLGMEWEFQSKLPTDNYWERLTASFHFMSIGWFVCLFASTLLIFTSLEKSFWSRSKLFTVLPGAATLLLFFFGLYGQYSSDKAEQMLATGEWQAALNAYKRSRLFDRQSAGTNKYYLAIGEIYSNSGRRSLPESLFFQLMQKKNSNVYDDAGALSVIYNVSPPPFQEIITRQWADIYVDLGLEQFSNGYTGQAVSSWTKALQIDPRQHHTSYFLAKGYFDIRQHALSINLNQSLLDVSENRILNASLLANIGDNLWELGQFGEARKAYNDSLSEDSQGNLRLIKSLGGT